MPTVKLFTSVSGSLTSDVVPIIGYDKIRCQVWSDAGATATVLLQERSMTPDKSAPWYTVATITNPSATGEYWVIPSAGEFQANISAISAGAVSVNLELARIGRL